MENGPARWILAAGVLALACGGEGSESPRGGSTRAELKADRSALLQSLTGELRVSMSDGRVSIAAEDALRDAVLRELASQAGFTLVANTIPSSRVSLMLEDEPLEAALGALLPGVGFRLEYDFDADSEIHALARVVVGRELAATTEDPSQPPVASAPGLRSRARSADSDPRWRALRYAKDPAERRRLHEEALAEDARSVELLHDPQAEVRAQAVTEIDMEGPGRDRAFALVESDPDASVRAAAVFRLIEEDSPAALDAVHAALDDTADVVVLQAIGALEMGGDASSLAPLWALVATHPSEEVRTAAKEVAEYIE